MNDIDLRQLRRVDAADTHPDPATMSGLDARMERLMAAEPSPAPAAPATRATRWTGRRLLALGGATAAVAAAAMVLPSVIGSDTAYAGWSAEPSKVAARDLDAVVAACRDRLDGPFGMSDDEGFDADTAKVVIAERRGDFVAVLMRGAGPANMSAFCVATSEPGSGKADDLQTGVAGSSGPAPTVEPKELMEGSMAQFGDNPASIVDGLAGRDVAKVTIHAPGGKTIEATVQNGRYAAWWPGKIFPDEPLPPSGEGGPEPQLTYDLTLRDGTVVKDAKPWSPDGPVRSVTSSRGDSTGTITSSP